MRKLAVMITTAALLTTAGVAQAAPAGEVQGILDQLTTTGGAQGVQVRINRTETHRSGTAERDSTKPVPQNGTFRTGSVEKTFVATVVLQLAGERRIELDAPVERYLPGVVKHQGITVRQLLQHTSGLFNYTDGLPLDPAGFPAMRFRTWQPRELVDMANAKPLNFEPGTKWQYSNTNYVLAGLLIEKITGKPYGKALEQRIFRPLHLTDTYLPGTSPDIRGKHAHGYYIDAEGKPYDVTRLNPSWGWAAGEMISTTKDLDTFQAALLAGKLLPARLQEELTRTTTASPNYGLGIAVVALPCGTKVYGHDGGIHGYYTEMLSTADGRKRMTFSMTVSGNEGDPFEAVNKLHQKVFC